MPTLLMFSRLVEHQSWAAHSVFCLHNVFGVVCYTVADIRGNGGGS